MINRYSKLEKSALSSEASLKTDVEGELICLSYNPEFFSVSKKDFITNILSAGYQEVNKQ